MAEEKTQEEKDKELQEAERKKSEERVKLTDEIFNKLRAELDKPGNDLQSMQAIVKEVADRLGKIQIVAAGAQYGPTPAQITELNEQELPILAEPMADGTPVANIAQARKEPLDKPEKPALFAPAVAKPTAPLAPKK